MFRAAVVVLVVAAALAAGASSAFAHAHVVFPTPGVMEVPNAPTHLRAGEHLTLVDSMPDAVKGGVVALQRESPTGRWRTLASAPVRPWVFWLHWHVPPRWAGEQIKVRFLLTDAGRVLAVSPGYEIAITGPGQR